MERQQGRIEPLRPKGFFYERKLSEVLLEFAEPLTREDRGKLTDEQFEDAIQFAILCWNISFLPPQEQKHLIDKMLDETCENDVACQLYYSRTAKALIEQRKMFYAEDRRMIMNYRFCNDAYGRHLIVASAPLK
jgi:hypothetical protein